MRAPFSAQLVNPYHNIVDLSTPEGNKLYQKATGNYLLLTNTLETQRKSSSSLSELKNTEKTLVGKQLKKALKLAT